MPGLGPPWSLEKTTTFIGALTHGQLCAPRLLDDAMDGDAFRDWCQQMLAPLPRSGNIVIMDNLPAHKVAGIHQIIEQTGAVLLYLPPYSSDFNLIENAFAKLKAYMRKAAARTVEALDSAVADALRIFNPDECANFFTHAGYGCN
jgi:transposase